LTKNILDFFISYAEPDASHANQLRTLLTGFGFETFVAEKDNQLSAGYVQSIKLEIEKRSVFIVLVTENSRYSPWVNQEIGYASSIDDKQILPIFTGRNLEGFIAGKHGISLWKDIQLIRTKPGIVPEDFQWARVVKSLLDNIYRYANPNLSLFMRGQMISHLSKVKDFYDSARIIHFIDDNFGYLQDTEINLIIDSAIHNPIVHESFGSQPILRKWLGQYHIEIGQRKVTRLAGLMPN
jgi:hypothetical protein